MNNIYYHQRNSNKELSYEIDLTFWKSFTGYIRRISNERNFQQYFGIQIDCDFLVRIDFNKLDNRMLEDLGFKVCYQETLEYTQNMPSTPQALSVIEFFYNYISYPIDEWYQYNIGEYICNKYDEKKARLEYTVKINTLFRQNRLGYKIKLGKIVKLHSKVLDDRFDNDNISDIDKVIKNEVSKAVKDFRNAYHDDIGSALTMIANVLERVKTLKGKNKKKSLSEIIQLITSNEELQPLIDEHIRSFTAISNKCDIRHKEVDSIEVADKDIKEFLFYSYYNLIRLILSKADMLE